MPTPDPNTSAMGRAILTDAMASEPVQQQTGVWSQRRIAAKLAAWADLGEEIAIQMGYQEIAAREPGPSFAGPEWWRSWSDQIAHVSGIGRAWSTAIYSSPTVRQQTG